MTKEEKIICKHFLNDADKTHCCNEYKLLMALLEQEPCEDCVSREFMYKLGAQCIAVRNKNGELVAIAAIENLPPVQPEVVPIAEIRFDDDKLHEIVNEAIKDIETAPRWILVRERLPKSHGTYQVTIQCEEGRYTNACYFDGSNTWHNDNRINHDRPYVTDKVIAWQEEPEPYKEESEDL